MESSDLTLNLNSRILTLKYGSFSSTLKPDVTDETINISKPPKIVTITLLEILIVECTSQNNDSV